MHYYYYNNMWNFSETDKFGYIFCAVRHKLVVCGTTGGLHAKIDFVHMDMRPISVVDGIGFREFCEALEPRYCIPSRGTVNKIIVKLYNRVCLILFNVNRNITSV